MGLSAGVLAHALRFGVGAAGSRLQACRQLPAWLSPAGLALISPNKAWAELKVPAFK